MLIILTILIFIAMLIKNIIFNMVHIKLTFFLLKRPRRSAAARSCAFCCNVCIDLYEYIFYLFKLEY